MLDQIRNQALSHEECLQKGFFAELLSTAPMVLYQEYIPNPVCRVKSVGLKSVVVAYLWGLKRR